VAANREFGIVGLGLMGGNLSLQALEAGMRVVGFDTKEPKQELRDRDGFTLLKDPGGFVAELAPPRVVFLYVPAGPVVDQVLDDLSEHLQSGDIIVDGGNSYWGDSIRRYQRLKDRGLQLVDCGTSGGVEGARHEACFMAGGETQAVRVVEPILKELAVPGGYVHAGPPGAGHFVKLVHNGIEFGMLQAIGEGVDLLERYHAPLNVADVLGCWTNGSVIRGWLIELMEREYRAAGGLKEIPPFVEDTGEVNWLVSDALRMQTAVPVIAQAVMQLFVSRDNQQNWARAVAMMRHGFGQHPYGPEESIARERTQGRVGDIYRPRGGNK
jgi:6-phosphogluconate dehydrogenase